MKFLVLETHDPYLNLAIEEYLFNHTEDDVFMLWQNEPTVVIGRNQNAFAEIDRAFVDKHNIKLARRITGGGAVYHDLGNVNYTFISNRSEQGINFGKFCAPIIYALNSMGVKVTLSGRNDLETADGAKISGNAQHTKDGRVLHHGTLLFSSDLEVLSSALKVDEEKLRSKAIKSTRSRVANIRDLLPDEMGVNKFISLLSKHIISTYSPEVICPPTIEEVSELYEKYASPEWIYPASDYLSGYTLVKKKRYPFGTVEVKLVVSLDTVRSVKLCGDFFGLLPIEELESIIMGADISELPERLIDISVGEYIHGMTAEELILLISE